MTIFGHELTIDSAVFWIIVVQAIFILIAAIIIIVLVARAIAAKRERAKRAEEYAKTHPQTAQPDPSFSVTQVYTSPEFSDKVEKYVEEILEQTKNASNIGASSPTYSGPYYYADMTPGAKNSPDGRPLR